MSFPPNPANRTEWTTYATIMLLAIVLTAFATALQVPQSITLWLRSVRMPAAMVERGGAPAPKASLGVCGAWQSQTSQKRYHFICFSDGSSFDIHEVTERGLVKIGSGQIAPDGTVEANLISIAKNRRGYWKLRLSSDGCTMQGPWHGDDPRESGQLTFYKVV